MDMHSGGGAKEDPYQYIYIEAPEDEAKRIFYAKFGHNPERVSCTCCGQDYSISSKASLAQLTGFERGCRSIETPRDPETGLYQNDDPVIVSGLYLEEGEEPPKGYALSRSSFRSNYQTLADYMKRDDVLFITADEIKPEWRGASVPQQGYVWVGDE
jgi:hypothetical protein